MPDPAVLAPPRRVDVVEVGLRDGLQSEAVTLDTADKLLLLDGLVTAGVTNIQLTSFVHPDKVPQLADAEDLCREALARYRAVNFSALALNLRGVERAVAAGLEHLDLGMSASEDHGRRNAGMGRQEAERQLLKMIAAAREAGMTVRAGVQCAFGCGSAPGGSEYEDEVVRLAAVIAGAGVSTLSLADSAGLANPLAIERLVTRVAAGAPGVPLVLHLHDTRGLGLANLVAALRHGVTRFDAAFGGLGGCPFIPGATGNVATEAVVDLLGAMGSSTGIDESGVRRVSQTAAGLLATGAGGGAEGGAGGGGSEPRAEPRADLGTEELLHV